MSWGTLSDQALGEIARLPQIRLVLLGEDLAIAKDLDQHAIVVLRIERIGELLRPAHGQRVVAERHLDGRQQVERLDGRPLHAIGGVPEHLLSASWAAVARRSSW